jgi:hypothetical protein
MTFAEGEAIDLELPLIGLENRWRGSSSNRGITATLLVQLYENLGQPARAERFLAEMASARMWHLSQSLRVTGAIYSQLDTIAAAKAVAELTRFADTVNAVAIVARRERWIGQAIVQLWRASRGDYSGLERTAAMGKPLLRSPHSAEFGSEEALMIAMLEAIGESRRKGERAALERLDSALARGANAPSLVRSLAALTAARLWEDRSDRVAALRALRRNSFDFSNSNKDRAVISREEGRLAAMTGDKATAIKAYERYLRFRANADPSLVADREKVRAELQRLTDSR